MSSERATTAIDTIHGRIRDLVNDIVTARPAGSRFTAYVGVAAGIFSLLYFVSDVLEVVHGDSRQPSW